MGKIDNDYFERIIVKNAMLDSTYLASIADFVKPDYFNNKNIAQYFKIVSDFYDKRQKLPTITEVKTYLTTKELKNGFKILVESFKELDNKFNKDELYENTEQFLKERGMYQAILESAELIGEEKADPVNIVSRFEEIAGINLELDRGFELYSGVDKMIDNILSEESVIPCRWGFVDDNIGGGFRTKGKALYMFAGQSNIGKSIFLGNVAANIASQNKTVLVVTLEMSEMMYAQRIASNITKIPMKDFKIETHNLRDGIVEERKKLPKAKILIKEFPPSTITPKQLQAFIKKLVDSGEQIDAVVIDYIGLLHSPQGSNSYERIKYVCEQVRAMSYIFECPFISATQIGRCIDVESLVLSENGEKKIGDVVVGDKILGSEGFVEIRHVYPRERKGCYKIKTKSGREIICSPNHIFPTLDGMKTIENGLCVGDKLFISATHFKNDMPK